MLPVGLGHGGTVGAVGGTAKAMLRRKAAMAVGGRSGPLPRGLGGRYRDASRARAISPHLPVHGRTAQLIRLKAVFPTMSDKDTPAGVFDVTEIQKLAPNAD